MVAFLNKYPAVGEHVMPRMRILNATEQEQFEKPPYFDAEQRNGKMPMSLTV
ncbi:MAG: hypothetical protein GY702_14300 [Desulfobulbaceae bacterium]|nr:hypothetical protein [Desulfobulbaceae bacterium]